MWNPDMMLKIAHLHEEELIRKAQLGRLPKTEAPSPTLFKRVLTVGLWLAAMASVVRWFIS